MVTETPKKGGAREAPTTPGPRRIDPTPQEAYFFLYILKHLKNKPEVDWEAVAQEANFKNGPTANKLGFAASPTPKKSKSSGEASGPKTPRSRVRKTAATPRKPKAKIAADDADDAEPGGHDEDPEQEAARLAKLHHPDHLENVVGHIKDEEDDEDREPPFSSSMFTDVADSGLASQYAV
ncbi:hypothetical protein RB595_004516 [Gaeumannomyces hyphopodioides]